MMRETYSKKSDLIRDLSEIKIPGMTQMLITPPEDYSVEDYYKILLDSPLGEHYEGDENTKYIIVELLPQMQNPVSSCYGNKFESGLTFWDKEFQNQPIESIDFELEPEEYGENDTALHATYPIAAIKAVGIHCVFQTTPITSIIHGDSLEPSVSGVSPVMLSPGGAIFTALCDAIINVIQLLTKAVQETVEYPEDVVIEFVVKGAPYMPASIANEPRALMKDVVALAENVGYRMLELRGKFFENIRTAVILLANPADIPDKPNRKKKNKLY